MTLFDLSNLPKTGQGDKTDGQEAAAEPQAAAAPSVSWLDHRSGHLLGFLATKGWTADELSKFAQDFERYSPFFVSLRERLRALSDESRYEAYALLLRIHRLSKGKADLALRELRSADHARTNHARVASTWPPITVLDENGKSLSWETLVEKAWWGIAWLSGGEHGIEFMKYLLDEFPWNERLAELRYLNVLLPDDERDL